MLLPMFSDLHNHTWTRPSMASNCLAVVDEFRILCKKLETRHAVFGGDYWEAIGKIPIDSLENGYRKIEELQRTVKLVWNLGNHARGNDGDHAEVVFGELKNVDLVRTPRVFRFDAAPKFRLAVIPYQGDNHALEQQIKAITDTDRKKGDRNVLLIHDGVRGAKVGPDEGYDPETGFNPGEHMFEDFDLVLAGHYHNPQAYKAGGSRVVFIGAPLEHKRGDRGSEPRGFLVIDTDSLKLTRYPMKFPTFAQIEVSTQADVDELCKSTEYKNNYLHVVYKKERLSFDTRKVDALDVTTATGYEIKTEVRMKTKIDDPFGRVLEGYIELECEESTDDPERRKRVLALGEDIAKRAGVNL